MALMSATYTMLMFFFYHICVPQSGRMATHECFSLVLIEIPLETDIKLAVAPKSMEGTTCTMKNKKELY
eukprot:c38354_g1_i1 orf=1-204(-)